MVNIKVQDLAKSYGEFEALKGISFEAKQGKILALLGPNGAGKTTTMRIITGFLSETAGTVEIDDLNIHENLEEIQNKIGYLPESAPLYLELSVNEHLDFVAETHGLSGSEKKKAIQRVAKDTMLTEHLHHNISELSKGFRQRVGLAQALIHDPSILILDEPTTGLDPNQIIEIRQLIKLLGKEKVVILSTHIMQEVEAICDQVVLIHHGEIIAEGTPAELMKKEGSQQKIRVVVKGSFPAAQAALGKLENVKEISHEEHPSSENIVFHILTEEDIRADINRALFEAELDVLEISAEKQNMEGVFQELTA